MAPMVKILDLLDFTFNEKPSFENNSRNNKKEYGLKLLLETLINYLNVSDLHIEMKEEDSMFLEEIIHGASSDSYDLSKIEKTVSELQVLGSSIVNTRPETTFSFEENKDSFSDLSETTFSPLGKPTKSLRSDEDPNASYLSEADKGNTSESLQNKFYINVYSTLGGAAPQPSDFEVSEETPREPTNKQSSVENAKEIFKQSADGTSSAEAIEKPIPLDYSNKIPEPEVIEKICLDFLNNFSKDCEDLKKIIDNMHEMFGEDCIETMRLMRQAADLAENNRLRQIYFHEGICKKIGKFGPKEDFKPIRRGPREIIIRRAKDLANNEEAKIGDLTESKEDIIREERVLPKLGELEESPPKKAEEESKRSFVTPITSPEDVTITKLNDLIKEHEDIKCYIEYLTYHVNTLADFIEASIPIIFANDPSMEGLQQRLREIHLTPSEYILTKKMQREIKEFFETFVTTVGDFEKRITNQGGLLLRLDSELNKKTTTLKNAIEGVRACLLKTAKQLNEKLDAKRESEAFSEDKLINFQVEVDKISNEQIFIFGEHKKMTTQLSLLKSLLEKMKDEIFKLNANKLEKLELQKLLATKADCSLLNSKVSETQFSLAYNDLTSGLNSLWNQLGGQNFIWDMLISNCTEFREKSISRDEFERGMKFMTKEMKKIKTALMDRKDKDDAEAIGVKTKYIRNLQCVSCNRGGKMKTGCGHPPFPTLPKLPITQGPRLDQTNKLENCSDSGFTNRYVGGSHTLIKPKEKILRKPEVVDVLFVQ